MDVTTVFEFDGASITELYIFCDMMRRRKDKQMCELNFAMMTCFDVNIL